MRQKHLRKRLKYSCRHYLQKYSKTMTKIFQIVYFHLPSFQSIANIEFKALQFFMIFISHSKIFCYYANDIGMKQAFLSFFRVFPIFFWWLFCATSAKFCRRDRARLERACQNFFVFYSRIRDEPNKAQVTVFSLQRKKP